MTSFDKKTVTPGQVIFRQGDSASDLYFISRGRVGIFLSHPQGDYLLHELTAGMLFGEMGFLSGPPQTVTATALDESVISRIPAEKFHQNTLGLPAWSLAIAKALAERLRYTTSAFERLIQERSHMVTFESDEPVSRVALDTTSLEIAYYPEADAQRLHLMGRVTTENVERLMNQVNDLRRQKVSPVILNFAGVTDVQKDALATIIEAARASSDVTGVIRLENVQFIAERFRLFEGFEKVLHSESAPIRRVAFGDHLMHQGDKGSEMYVVKSGSFTIYRTSQSSELVLWKAQPGDVLGEIALITGKLRSASVRADQTSQVYVISLESFRKNAYHIPPWFQRLMEGLAARVCSINQTLEDYLSGKLKPVALVQRSTLTISENFRVPGECYLHGTLDLGTLKELQAYIGQRLKAGTRQFSFDLTGMTVVDPRALRYFVKFQEYLLGIHGQLRNTGQAV